MPNTDDFRIKRIKKMLLEMAKGNFFYSLEPSDKNDNIASLVVLLNMVIGVIVDVMTGGAGVELVDEEKPKDQA